MTHADDVQAVSVDEALIDVTMSLEEFRNQARYTESLGDPAKEFAEVIRAEVRKATTCESKLDFRSLKVSFTNNVISQHRYFS